MTVRLPTNGNDEITDLSKYFNQTIAKIGTAIRSVGLNSGIMEKIGNELASNMNETASAVHQISAHIDDVKQQALTQAAGVTKSGGRYLRKLSERLKAAAEWARQLLDSNFLPKFAAIRVRSCIRIEQLSKLILCSPVQF